MQRLKLLERICIVLAVLLSIAAGVSYWYEQPEPPALALAAPKIDVGRLTLAHTIEVTFTMTNRADVPLRIVGVLDEPC